MICFQNDAATLLKCMTIVCEMLQGVDLKTLLPSLQTLCETLVSSYPTALVGVFARVRGEGRELPGVGALAICLCRYVCHGVRVPMGGWSWVLCELGSWDELWQIF